MSFQNNGDPASRVRKASGLLAAAAGRWNAGSVTALGNCLSALEQSAAELRAIDAKLLEQAKPSADLRADLLEVKNHIAELARMSDFAASMLRGGIRIASDSPLYGSGGREEAPDVTSHATAIQA